MEEKPQFADIVRSWSTRCSKCGEPCIGEEVKELALGCVMHLRCYDKFLQSQEDEPAEAKWRRAAMTEQIRLRMEKWEATAKWTRGNGKKRRT